MFNGLVASKRAEYYDGVWCYTCKGLGVSLSAESLSTLGSQQKLRGQFTHRVSEAMCQLAAHFDFREAALELSRQGIEVSHTTIHQQVRKCEKELSVSRQVAPQKLAANKRMYLSCDVSWTNSTKGWTEV